GQIFIQDDQGVNITNAASNKSSANFYPNDGVYLYFNGNQKLRTTNTGVTVTGTVVATGADINGDIDVDGHTNLDNVSIAGVTTFAGAIDANGNLDVAGISTLGSGGSGSVDLQYQGSTKLTTANWGIQVSGTLQTTNFIKTLNQNSSTNGKSIFLTNTSGNLLEIGHTSSNSFITGHVGNISINAPTVSISTNFSVGGISTFSGNVDVNADLDVDGHTNLDNVSIAGVVTATTINATTFVGNGDFVELDVDGHTELDNVNIAGVVTATTFKGALEATSASFSSNIDANGDLDVDGHTNLDNVSIAGVSTFNDTLHISSNAPVLKFTETDNSKDFFIVGDSNKLSIRKNTTGGGNVVQEWMDNSVLFRENVDIDADLDVDGHTNLDNVSVVGMVTVTNVSSGIALNLIDSAGKKFIAGGGGGSSPFAGSGTNHDFRIQVGGTQNAIFKYGAGATGNLELGPASGIGITFNGSTGNAGYAGIITATKFVGDGSGLTGITASGSGVVI
ncbi:MAG: hypothetical protein VXY93_10380, partial [Pseudomonadota bacterium]|nr:hypothetical protein [Pseudomonadota bacterium]